MRFVILMRVFFFTSVCSTLSENGPEIFLSPAVTYGPPGLDLSCPIAMTVAHCGEVDAGNWTIRLKRQMQDNKWEVSSFATKKKKTPTHNFFFFTTQEYQ